MFETIIRQTADVMQMDESAIKKDYYVTLLLKEISKVNTNIIFKGGTSLSKAWHAINRFSEDIDLTCESHPTQGSRRNISHSIKDIIKKNNLKLINEEDVNSKMDYNQYVVSYENGSIESYLKEDILIETTYFLGCFPSQIVKVGSYVYDYLKSISAEKIISRYELETFDIRVQNLERTFIDKVFAICDYYLRKDYSRNSRHIYDLYKLYPLIKMDENFKELVLEVRELRKSKKFCESAQEENRINELLEEIKKDKSFKDDYSTTTEKMFYNSENVTYEESITVIDKIISSNMF